MTSENEKVLLKFKPKFSRKVKRKSKEKEKEKKKGKNRKKWENQKVKTALTSNHCHHPRSSILCSYSYSLNVHFRHAKESYPKAPLDSIHFLSFCIRQLDTKIALWHSSWRGLSNQLANQMSRIPSPSFHAMHYNQVHFSWKSKRTHFG